MNGIFDLTFGDELPTDVGKKAGCLP